MRKVKRHRVACLDLQKIAAVRIKQIPVIAFGKEKILFTVADVPVDRDAERRILFSEIGFPVIS